MWVNLVLQPTGLAESEPLGRTRKPCTNQHQIDLWRQGRAKCGNGLIVETTGTGPVLRNPLRGFILHTI